MSPNDLLNQLLDIHPPIPVSFWPPAPGWWIVAVFLTLFSGIVGWRYRRYYLSQSFKRIAIQKLKQLHKNYQHNHNSTQLVIELSILLRRVALAKFPRRQVAGLIGTAWLQFLDEKMGNTKEFTEGQGQVLRTAPYQKSSHIDIKTLLNLATVWIEKQ